MKLDININIFTLTTINKMWSSIMVESGSYVVDIEKSILQKLQKDLINKQVQRIGKKDNLFKVSMYAHEAHVFERYFRIFNDSIWHKESLEHKRIHSLCNEIQPMLL